MPRYLQLQSAQIQTRTTTHSCGTRKRAVHFYSPVGVRHSHAAALHACSPSLLPLLQGNLLINN